MPLSEDTTQAKRTVLRMFPYGMYVITSKGENGEIKYGADHQLVAGEIVDAAVFREGDAQMMQAAGMKYSG